MLSAAPLLLLLFGASLTTVNGYPKRLPRLASADNSLALILTDLIESGDIAKARALSKVSGGPFPEHIPSYSGFFTVNKQFNSNLYFWFFPAQTNSENAPVLLWLQGGPGASSLFGLFTELGPFSVDNNDNETLIENPYSWHKNHSIVFIDNPVGTGFSFTDDDQGYATNQTQVGDELYKAMIQFFKLFPELQQNPFFITGESYSGKYVPALGYTIHKNNPSADLKINLQGIAVGNGLTDPETMLNYSEYLFQLGLVDTYFRDEMRTKEQAGRDFIKHGQYVKAFQAKGQVLGMWRYQSHFSNFYNILHSDENRTRFAQFVGTPEVLKLLHVGKSEYNVRNRKVYRKMIPDIMVSAKPWLEVLLDNYRVLYYSGQLDVICAYPMSVQMYQTLNFSAIDEYLEAERKVWLVDGDIAGYAKSGGKFTEVLVRNAGHMVPADQPVWALDLINRFTSNNMP